MRALFIVLLCMGVVGCTKESDKYGCWDGDCAWLNTDVWTLNHVHIVDLVTNIDGSKWFRLADDHLYYICGADVDCVKRRGPDSTCVEAMGCKVAHKKK